MTLPELRAFADDPCRQNSPIAAAVRALFAVCDEQQKRLLTAADNTAAYARRKIDLDIAQAAVKSLGRENARLRELALKPAEWEAEAA